MTKLTESQAKKHKEQMEFEKERDRAFLKFKEKEVENNRWYELEIAKIFASSMNNSNNREILDIPLLIKLPFFNIRFNTLQIFIMLQVPHHNLHHHQCHLLNIVMQAHPSGHLTVQNKT